MSASWGPKTKAEWMAENDAIRARVAELEAEVDCGNSTDSEACGGCRACAQVGMQAALADVADLRAQLAAAQRERDLALMDMRRQCAAAALGAVRHSQQTTDQCRAEVQAAVEAVPVERVEGRDQALADAIGIAREFDRRCEDAKADLAEAARHVEALVRGLEVGDSTGAYAAATAWLKSRGGGR